MSEFLKAQATKLQKAQKEQNIKKKLRKQFKRKGFSAKTVLTF